MVDTSSDERVRVLHRVVMPTDPDPDALRLYVADDVVFRNKIAQAAAGASEVSTGPQLEGNEVEIVGRRSVVIPAGKRVSFCSYFNAFPAGYWRRWSMLDKVRLRLRMAGEGAILVYRSRGTNDAEHIHTLYVDSDAAVPKQIELSLAPFVEGGWYWFEIVAYGRTVVLEEADWCTVTDQTGHGTATIGITTFNRPDWCVGQLFAIAESDSVLDVIDEVIVIDQGTEQVSAHPDFSAAAEALGPRLRVVCQTNLGSSGGFARAMLETLQADRSNYVVVLDDDVILEPESIVRCLHLADLARSPTIVGGHMFDIYRRSVLHEFGAVVSRQTWWVDPAPYTGKSHDMAAQTLRQTDWLHRRADGDYCAWWMCLIPTDVIRKIGLSFPFFIKWDDIEYGLRAGVNGVPAVTLPGAGVWHAPWRSKDDEVDWHTYFNQRNRLITVLLYSAAKNGGRLPKTSFSLLLRQALAMQYSTVELRLSAIDDVLKGPAALHSSMLVKASEIRELQSRFVDAQGRSDVDAFPPVQPRKSRVSYANDLPMSSRRLARAGCRGVLRQLLPVGDHVTRNPEAIVSFADRKWWRLIGFNSVLVSSADGTKVYWYQRDTKRFWSLMRRAALAHLRLRKNWNRLRTDYRNAVLPVTSPGSWSETFETAERQSSKER